MDTVQDIDGVITISMGKGMQHIEGSFKFLIKTVKKATNQEH